jgi:hypothetical protein
VLRPEPGPRRAPRTVASISAAAVAVQLALAVVGPTAAIEPQESANRLDRVIEDLALLEPRGADTAPALLTIDRTGMPDGVVRAAILGRDRAWTLQIEQVIDLHAESIGPVGRPWLIGIDPTSFALIATSQDPAQTVIVGLRTDAGPGRNDLLDIKRTVLPIAVDDAAAADIDGDGRQELVVASARTVRQGGACQGSEIWTLDAQGLGLGPGASTTPTDPLIPVPWATLVTADPIPVAGRRLAGGVTGRFDDRPGDDLLAYAYPNCPAGPDQGPHARLMSIRLADGEVITDAVITRDEPLAVLTAPLRVDLDDDGADEFVAQTERGLTLADPRRDPSGVRLASDIAIPLVSMPRPGAPADRPEATVAWLEPPTDQQGRLGVEHVARAADGTLDGAPATVMFPNGEPTERWLLIQSDVVASSIRGQPPTAWTGALDDPACPDVLLPGAVLGCGDGELEPGAAWIATRPIGLYGEGSGERLLVASGIGWTPNEGMPASPSPWAAAPAGWWRHGPSEPFVLAELRAGDASYYKEFPEPRATLERATLPDASIAIPGFTGVRFFVTATPVEGDSGDPPPGIDIGQALGRPLKDSGQAGTVRVPVPPGVDAGRDGSVALVPLADVHLPDGSPAEQWTVTAVPLNDWGEIGDPVIGGIIRDRVGPSLEVDSPFMTPIWPFPASIKGSAEPGSIVEVEGIGPVEPDRRGGFRISTSLAPWPQTLTVTATDASGNETVREVSLIGGVDYRRFPWPTIAAIVLLIVVAISGVFGSRWRRKTGPAATGVASFHGAGVTTDRAFAMYGDEIPMAEIEDLPPGEGIGRA